LGQPAVNIGDRQNGRERAENVTDVPCESTAIHDAVQSQLQNGAYEPSTLYGEGDAAKKIVDALREINFELKGSMDPSRLGLTDTTTTLD
jgi:UDP-N-acetylglucosamine 2-epimerase